VARRPSVGNGVPNPTRFFELLEQLGERGADEARDLVALLRDRARATSRQVYFFFVLAICSAARFLAISSAWSAGTLTSGLTPVPSQFVFVIGLIARA
jgi:hypothetical protein